MLDVRDNFLTRIEETRILRDLPLLSELFISGNPLATKYNYIDEIFMYLERWEDITVDNMLPSKQTRTEISKIIVNYFQYTNSSIQRLLFLWRKVYL